MEIPDSFLWGPDSWTYELLWCASVRKNSNICVIVDNDRILSSLGLVVTD